LKLIAWWKMKKAFKSKDGGSHQLYYQATGKSAQMMVASSNPDKVQNFLSNKLTAATDAGEKGQIKEAQKKYNIVVKSADNLQKLQDKPVPASKEGKRKRKSDIDKANDILRKAVDIFSISISGLNFEKETDLLVKSVIKPSSGSKANKVEANPITWLSGNTIGSTPKENPPGWLHATQIDVNDKGKRTNQWVRGHLLSMHFHGPGQSWNLVPINQKANSDMASIENSVKTHIHEKGNILHYKAEVQEWHQLTPPANNDFPKTIVITWGFQEAQRQGGKAPTFNKISKSGIPKSGKRITITSPAPPLVPASIQNINDVGRKTIYDLTGASHRFLLVLLEEKDAGGRFTNYSNLKTRMENNQGHQFADAATLQSNLTKIYHASKGANKKIDIK